MLSSTGDEKDDGGGGFFIGNFFFDAFFAGITVLFTFCFNSFLEHNFFGDNNFVNRVLCFFC